MKNRFKLIEYFAELGFMKGAEIGVFDGRFSEIICQKIPDVNLLVIDNWEIERWSHGYVDAKKLLAPFRNVTILRGTSMHIGKAITDESLDFVFIDADHKYESVKEDIELWSQKVRVGGIVSGHDYYVTRAGNEGVIVAVDNYIKEHGYTLQTTDWDIKSPIEDDRQPCWYFVKDK